MSEAPGLESSRSPSPDYDVMSTDQDPPGPGTSG